jgi:serine/threonine-protein kinase
MYPQGPMWVPPGDWVAFTDYFGTVRQVFGIHLRSGEVRLIQANAQAGAYTAGSWLYYSGGALWAADFDQKRLAVKGPATQIVSGVAEENYIAQSSASLNGVVAYVPGATSNFSRSLYLVNRRGIEEKLAVPADDYVDPAVSPDGKRIAICIRSAGATGQQLALYDRDDRVLTRLISNAAMNEAPVWTADGKSLLFNIMGSTSEKPGIYRIGADGESAPQLLVETSMAAHVTSASATYGAVMASDPVTSIDLWLVSLSPPYGMRVFRRTRATERQATFSPDGHWLAYASNESGRSEVYVEPVPGPGGRWQISAGGGEQPRWARNGREIFYRNGTKVMLVPVVTSPAFRAQPARELFDRKFDRGGGVGGYDATPDGQLFVMTRSEHQNATEIRVVMGWPEQKQ